MWIAIIAAAIMLLIALALGTSHASQVLEGAPSVLSDHEDPTLQERRPRPQLVSAGPSTSALG